LLKHDATPLSICHATWTMPPGFSPFYLLLLAA
jgi:hypothetical protein